MSDQEDFLTRWSRRKREAAQPPAETEEAAPAPERTLAAPSEEPTLDLTALPPIEEITATTDIRAYLAPGVPAELTRAALRRAWATDPTIRDFIGIAENQWDFNDPHGIPGFGPIEDAGRLVAQLLGEDEGHAAPPANPPAPGAPEATEVSAGRPDGTSLPDAPAIISESASAADDQPLTPAPDVTIAAPQQQDRSEHAPISRSHGGALPK